MLQPQGVAIATVGRQLSLKVSALSQLLSLPLAIGAASISTLQVAVITALNRIKNTISTARYTTTRGLLLLITEAALNTYKSGVLRSTELSLAQGSDETVASAAILIIFISIITLFIGCADAITTEVLSADRLWEPRIAEGPQRTILLWIVGVAGLSKRDRWFHPEA